MEQNQELLQTPLTKNLFKRFSAGQKVSLPEFSLSKFGPGVFLVLVVLAGTLVGLFFGIRYRESGSFSNDKTKIEDLNRQLVQKEEEIQLFLQDRAKTENYPKSPYSFETFGIYSPLFENKEVTELVYTYKRRTIIERRLVLEQDKYNDPTAQIIVWEYTDSDYAQPYVIFVSGDSPMRIDLNPEDRESYINPKNIKMFWYSESCRGCDDVTLEFFIKYTPSGNPIYVQARVSNPSPYRLDKPDKLKEKLRKIAETIEEFSTHH